MTRATALIVVDVQNDFADPAGSLSVAGGEAVIPVINAEIASAADAGAITVFTQDWHPESTPHFAKDGGPWPVHCVAETWGAVLHPDLAVPDGAPRIRKGANGEDGYSGFTMRDATTGEELPTELDGLLRDRGVERVVVVGLATDYCVKATALDAVRLGYETHLLTDAIASVDLALDDGAASHRGDGRGRCRRVAGRRRTDVQLHLVDATYELFRAHYAPRPDVVGRDGIILSGVSGLCDQLLYLLREEGATHVGAPPTGSSSRSATTSSRATSRPPACHPNCWASSRSPRPRSKRSGSSSGRWSNSRPTTRSRPPPSGSPQDERVECILVCTPDKDMAQLVRDERIVLWDRRRGLTYDDAGVRAKWGVPPTSIPD